MPNTKIEYAMKEKLKYIDHLQFAFMAHLLNNLGLNQINRRIECFRMKEAGKKIPTDAAQYTKERMVEVEGQVIFEKHYGFDYCLRILNTQKVLQILQ
jgi:hypothetical protein